MSIGHYSLPASQTPVVPYHAILRSVVRPHYAEFLQNFWDTIEAETLAWNWHLGTLCEEVQKVCELVIAGRPKEYDLICNLPPGSTKSSVVSVFLTPWLWTRMPRARVLNSSFGHDLSLDLALKSRSVVDSEKYRETFPEVMPNPSQWTKSFFKNLNGGYRFATSSMGSVTGRHGHVLVSDDSMDPEGVFSIAEHTKVNRWLRGTFSSRKVNKKVSVTIVCQQRLAENDETGDRLTRREKVPVKHLCLPAEVSELVNPAELKANYIDGLLDPVRLPKSVLVQAYEELGQYSYAGQYEQNPVPPDGGMFKVARLRIENNIPEGGFYRILRFWDKAGTRKGGAFTVGVKMGMRILDKKHRKFEFWVLDVVRGQWAAGDREKEIERVAFADGKKVEIGIEQEGGSGGKESAEGSVIMLTGFRVRVMNPGSEGSKEERADYFATQVNIGNVVLVKGDWNDAYKLELALFPLGRYKDQVDASSGAFGLLTKRKRTAGAI